MLSFYFIVVIHYRFCHFYFLFAFFYLNDFSPQPSHCLAHTHTCTHTQSYSTINVDIIFNRCLTQKKLVMCISCVSIFAVKLLEFNKFYFILFSILFHLSFAGTSRCWFRKWTWNWTWASCTPSWISLHQRTPTSWLQRRRCDALRQHLCLHLRIWSQSFFGFVLFFLTYNL